MKIPIPHVNGPKTSEPIAHIPGGHLFRHPVPRREEEHRSHKQGHANTTNYPPHLAPCSSANKETENRWH